MGMAGYYSTQNPSLRQWAGFPSTQKPTIYIALSQSLTLWHNISHFKRCYFANGYRKLFMKDETMLSQVKVPNDVHDPS